MKYLHKATILEKRAQVYGTKVPTVLYTYIKMVSLHAKALKVSSVEYQGPEVVVDGLEERLGRAREREVCEWDVSIPLISIYAILSTRY